MSSMTGLDLKKQGVRLITNIRRGEFEFGKIENISNKDNKPEGGLWGTPYSESREFYGWVQWNNAESTGWINPKGMIDVVPTDDTKVLWIDNIPDAQEFSTRYSVAPKLDEDGKDIYWTNIFGKCIDWETVSKEYDLFIVSDEALCTHPFDGRSRRPFDCDSVIILNKNCIEEVKGLSSAELNKMYPDTGLFPDEEAPVHTEEL